MRLCLMSQIYHQYEKTGMQVTGTYPNLTVFSACCEVFAIGGETDTADVEVSGALSGFIKEDTGCQYS
jgi:hypothetical protein